MSTYDKIYSGLTRVAWGYLFLYFDINLGPVSILPRFVAFFFFLSAINLLDKEEQELSLIRRLGVLLLIWNLLQWSLSWVGISLDGMWQFADILVILINLYFHFQLLTNLASVVMKYQQKGYQQHKTILRCRTIQTIALTIADLTIFIQPELSDNWLSITSILVLWIYVITGIFLIFLLFQSRKYIDKNPNIYKNSKTSPNSTIEVDV